MVNIPINEAETIFEAFYDGGESYPDHQKYTPLNHYTISYAQGAEARVFQCWDGVQVLIQHQIGEDYAVRMECQCDLSIEDYDIFRLFATVHKEMDVRISCCMDGCWMQVLEASGCGNNVEYDGSIHGSKISAYALEFRSRSENSVCLQLIWMGLSNSVRQKAMESKKSPYTSEWEGCFVENPEIKPMIGIFFGEEELTALRTRLNHPPFKKMTDALRERAQKAMETEPEAHIYDYVPNLDRRWVRDRDIGRTCYFADAEELAFIGLLDENLDMLRMACRKMLSVAVTPHWTESIMGCLPGATWHHRSFTEDRLCSLCAKVLDWAGSLLTWHGKNIVYDAIMLKGLPRLEADFHSVDYIWEMNQGIVFNHARVLALLALAHRYPRYEARLAVAEQDEQAMINRYVQDDGGILEGPSYWNYTFSHSLITIAVLARHAGVSLQEYAWDKLKKTGEYALSILSDTEDGLRYLPFNDAHTNYYDTVISAIFKQISDDPRWEILYANGIKNADFMSLVGLLMADNAKNVSGAMHRDGLISLDTTGFSSIRRSTQDVGRVHFCAFGGTCVFSHCHGDKGQIILEVDGTPMLIDRGTTTYSSPFARMLPKSELHNLFYPEAPEGEIAYDQNVHGKGGIVRCSNYENGVYAYETDLVGAWSEGIYESVTRKVRSEDPHLYLIYDDARYVDELSSSFRLQTRGEIAKTDAGWTITQNDYQITVMPVNYIPEKATFGEECVDEHVQPVNSLKLYLCKAKEHHAITLLEVSKVGENCAKVLSEKEISYQDKVYRV